MTVALREKILERMEAKNLSIAELERLAGLSIHSVRNIVKGRIKRPSAQSLQAIAEALECSIVDLVEPTAGSTGDLGFSFQRRKKSGPPLTHHALMLECCHTALELVNEYEQAISLDEYLDIVKKIYTYSSKEEPIKLDLRFSQWLIETHLNGVARKSAAT